MIGAYHIWCEIQTIYFLSLYNLCRYLALDNVLCVSHHMIHTAAKIRFQIAWNIKLRTTSYASSSPEILLLFLPTVLSTTIGGCVC